MRVTRIYNVRFSVHEHCAPAALQAAITTGTLRIRLSFRSAPGLALNRKRLHPFELRVRVTHGRFGRVRYLRVTMASGGGSARCDGRAAGPKPAAGGGPMQLPTDSVHLTLYARSLVLRRELASSSMWVPPSDVSGDIEQPRPIVRVGRGRQGMVQWAQI
jgi:hypothetical protein